VEDVIVALAGVLADDARLLEEVPVVVERTVVASGSPLLHINYKEQGTVACGGTVCLLKEVPVAVQS
jgi:hypothetical protein